MASKLTISMSLARLVGGKQASIGSIAPKVVQIEPGTDLVAAFEQAVGFAAEEALIVTDVTDDAMVVLINNDPTNFVEVGTGSFTAVFSIPPGELAILPRASVLANLRLKADTASVQVTVLLYKI